MGSVYRAFRAVFMLAVAIMLVVPAVLFVALSLPSVQNGIRGFCESELSELTGAEVVIGDLGIKPFNRAILRDVAVIQDNDTVFKARRLGAGVSLYELVVRRKIALNFVELIGGDLRVSRAAPDAPLNIQPIIDKLQNKDEQKPPTKFNVRINTVIIRRTALSYDVLSEPSDSSRFDANHIAVYDLQTDVNIPKLKNDKYIVNLRRLAFSERSGFRMENLQGDLKVTPEEIGWQGVQLALPRSEILVNDGQIKLDGLESLPRKLAEDGVKLSLAPQSHIYLPSLAMFASILNDLDYTIDMQLDATLRSDAIDVGRLRLSDRFGNVGLDISNSSVSGFSSAETLDYDLGLVRANVGGSTLAALQRKGLLGDAVKSLPGTLSLNVTGAGTALAGKVNAVGGVDDGRLSIDGSYKRNSLDSPVAVEASVTASDIDLGEALRSNEFGKLNADVKGKGLIGKRMLKFDAEVSATDLMLHRHSYDKLTANMDYDNGEFEGQAILYDDAGNVFITFDGSNRRDQERFAADVTLKNLNPYAMNLTEKYEGYSISGAVAVDFKGKLPDRADGFVNADDVVIVNGKGEKLDLGSLSIESRCVEKPRTLHVESELISGEIVGDFDLKTLPATAKSIALHAFDAFVEGVEEFNQDEISDGDDINRFYFGFTINQTEELARFFNWPVSVIYPVTIDGNFDGARGFAKFDIEAPYLRQGNKVLENAMVTGIFDGISRIDNFYVSVQLPTKQGLMSLLLNADAAGNKVDADAAWYIDSAKRYEGTISLLADLNRDERQQMGAAIDIEPSYVVINDSVWTINPAKIVVESPEEIIIENLNAERHNQFVKINGKVSKEPTDTLTVDLLNVDLDYVFESLAIDAVMLGGDATGKVVGSSLLTQSPRLETDGIYVKDISYNKCWFGDAIVTSHWDVENKAVVLDGTIMQPKGHTSYIKGSIFPMSSSLDMNFEADSVPLGFMGKYMAAFASDITGHGSGKARLYGTFHDIDMSGDMFVDNLKLKLNFTNTYYSATDSLHISPGLIKLNDIELKDIYGNTATLNGEVRHKYFRDPSFDFSIDQARSLLAYDESAKTNPDWYGRIFVNGGAKVHGVPGMVSIDVDASSAAGSTFTFVLSELEVADEYTFLTFRDKDELLSKASIKVEDKNMGLVNRIKALSQKNETQSSTDYVIELRVAITPQAEINLVMDPVAGDKIRSHGSGNLRMVYTSKDNDLRMFGEYTLERGTYNFTLQDIIIKDFTINEGSSIKFTGDPLDARLNIEAVYSLNANLSDLDESFVQDKDLTRTNVPVHAILKVSGSIQNPDIGFDLAFPTLTSDVDRKVRSIISTDEMLTRQIIYLLALNRFYTPDYMGSTTKGNELFSVASSTITSQLSNILGHLSDNWAISPNLRSDRGDFSDVEVDVALSSRLLKNRLLLTGNLGYRDKSMNNNQFVGDFDVEYLLNRAGTVRLKAYSHYNDENYYVRTAATTQGVGVAFKRDFDNVFSFLRRMKKKSTSAAAPSAASDTTASAVSGESAPFVQTSTKTVSEGSASTSSDSGVSKPSSDRQRYVPDAIPQSATIPDSSPDPLLIFK